MSRVVDHLVVGGGVMGSAAAWQLARRGRDGRPARTVRAAGTSRGASHGASRIYRQHVRPAPSTSTSRRRRSTCGGCSRTTPGSELLTLTGGVSHGAPAPREVADAFVARGIPHELALARRRARALARAAVRGDRAARDPHRRPAARRPRGRRVPVRRRRARRRRAARRAGPVPGRRSGDGVRRRDVRRARSGPAASSLAVGAWTSALLGVGRAAAAGGHAGAARALRAAAGHARRLAVVHARPLGAAPVAERHLRAGDPRRGDQGRLPRRRPRDRPRPPHVHRRARTARAAAGVRGAVAARRRPSTARADLVHLHDDARPRLRPRPPRTAGRRRRLLRPRLQVRARDRPRAGRPRRATTRRRTPSFAPRDSRLPPVPTRPRRRSDDPPCRAPVRARPRARPGAASTGADALRVRRRPRAAGRAARVPAGLVRRAPPGAGRRVGRARRARRADGERHLDASASGPPPCCSVRRARVVAAEQFGTVAALHPGRVDLGLGRASFPPPRKAAVPDAAASTRARPVDGAEDRVVDGLLVPGHAAAQLRRPRPCCARGSSPSRSSSAPAARRRRSATSWRTVLALQAGTARRRRPRRVVSPRRRGFRPRPVGARVERGGERARRRRAGPAARRELPREPVDGAGHRRGVPRGVRPGVLDEPYVVVSADVLVAETAERAAAAGGPVRGVGALDPQRARARSRTRGPARRRRGSSAATAERALLRDRIDTRIVGDADVGRRAASTPSCARPAPTSS